MKELVCIVCPNSCKLSISENGEVTGARCPRGKKFATEELTCPKRTVCTTVATVFDDYPVLPVRTETEIPKDKIPALMELVNNFTLKKTRGARRGRHRKRARYGREPYQHLEYALRLFCKNIIIMGKKL